MIHKKSVLSLLFSERIDNVCIKRLYCRLLGLIGSVAQLVEQRSFKPSLHPAQFPNKQRFYPQERKFLSIPNAFCLRNISKIFLYNGFIK
jgi:hypothetical protein